MGFHPHIHAIVPGGGPALDGSQWMVTRHPTERNREKPYLTHNVELGRVFRKQFADGLRRLVRSGKLKLEDEWANLTDSRELNTWLDELTQSDWNVFIEGPPHGKSRPERVLRYLARYLTGGPISDIRIVSEENGQVTFMARGKNKAKGNRPRPFSLPGKEFVRRWAMHILPKGYTRSRQFGGFHGRKRDEYLKRCRELLVKSVPAIAMTPIEPPAPPRTEASLPKCRHCDVPMRCIEQRPRPSWKVVFGRSIHEDNALYSPMHHICSRAPPAFPHDDEG